MQNIFYTFLLFIFFVKMLKQKYCKMLKHVETFLAFFYGNMLKTWTMINTHMNAIYIYIYIYIKDLAKSKLIICAFKIGR